MKHLPVSLASLRILTVLINEAGLFRELSNNFLGKKHLFKFFDADPDPGSGVFLLQVLVPGSRMDKVGSGILDGQSRTYLG